MVWDRVGKLHQYGERIGLGAALFFLTGGAIGGWHAHHFLASSRDTPTAIPRQDIPLAGTTAAQFMLHDIGSPAAQGPIVYAAIENERRKRNCSLYPDLVDEMIYAELQELRTRLGMSQNAATTACSLRQKEY